MNPGLLAIRKRPIVSPLYSAVILGDTPLGYWRLGESSGSTAADSSGNSYNGTYVNCTQGAPSLINNNGGDLAVSGDGTSSQIIVGAVPALYNLSRSFSFECWAKPASVSGYYGLWSAGYQGWCVRMNSGQLSFTQDYSVYIGTITTNFAVNTRYHIVCVMSSAGIVTAYINGVSVGTLDMSAYTYSGQYVRIGADGYGPGNVGNFMSGELDEVAVYNYMLTPTQISNHYNTGK